MESTLVLIKPDGVRQALCGEIIRRFERRGLRLAAMKLQRIPEELAKRHYAEHEGKPFFPALVEFITSGPVVAMVVQGENAIQAVRTMMGKTNPLEAAPGTIRGDFALNLACNVVHGSDSPASAAREISNFFSPGEIYAPFGEAAL